MRLLAPASILALASLALAEAASDVLSLTSADFEGKISSESLLLVEFFAPWCGHCKALAPHYEEAATALKDKGIKLAKVDCVEEADLCQSKGVQGYPTLKVYRNGEVTDYNGPRKADGIISYMVKQSLPAVSDVTAEKHEEFTKADKIVAIAYLPSSSVAPAAEFSAVAETHRDDYLFGVVTDADAAAAAGVTPPAVVVYRSFDDFRTEYPYPISGVTKKDLSDWIAELAIPVLDEVNGETYAVYAKSTKPLAYVFLDPSSEDKDAQIDIVKPIAKKYKSKVNFVWIDAVKYGDHGKALNLPEAKWPSFVIQDMEKQLKYPFDQSKELTTEAVGEFLDQFINGKLEPSLKSQAVPETQDEPVYTLVGKNFEQVALEKDKDVFVEFYAAWCGHCKRLKPIWDQLGEKYSAIKDKLVIAKFEVPENDLPPTLPFRITGFPTIKFKPAGSTEFIDYEGDRSLESLISFVEANAKNSLEIPAAKPKADEPEAQAPVADEGVKHEEL
ncbi:disulfide isomerase [Coprinopsis marcescibilis]|uniref:Protein disulfide-isomerase n=1 Tax=Coprinopsis marcescibilis TaxID=230819 RepID=A0A5C3KSS5_COPMA|nr:disulfide isomerase [Coprinopsis marcescibilis]